MAFLFGEIMKEKLKNFWKSYIDITKIYKATNARLFASSIAFFVFLAIFPTILLDMQDQHHDDFGFKD